MKYKGTGAISGDAGEPIDVETRNTGMYIINCLCMDCKSIGVNKRFHGHRRPYPQFRISDLTSIVSPFALLLHETAPQRSANSCHPGEASKIFTRANLLLPLAAIELIESEVFLRTGHSQRGCLSMPDDRLSDRLRRKQESPWTQKKTSESDKPWPHLF